MNIIELKKKYNKIYKLTIENIEITYRPFNAQELILLMKPNHEDKYKDDISREAVINKEDYDKLKNWTSKELIYKNILKISTFTDQKEIIKNKLLIKEELQNNPYLLLIKQILRYMPSMDINKLLECNVDQLLFYVVLCEELSGKTIIESNPLKTKNPEPMLKTKKKAELNPENTAEIGMMSSVDALKEKLEKRGVSVKEFSSVKKDPFEE